MPELQSHVNYYTLTENYRNNVQTLLKLSTTDWFLCIIQKKRNAIQTAGVDSAILWKNSHKAMTQKFQITIHRLRIHIYSINTWRFFVFARIITATIFQHGFGSSEQYLKWSLIQFTHSIATALQLVDSTRTFSFYCILNMYKSNKY